MRIKHFNVWAFTTTQPCSHDRTTTRTLRRRSQGVTIHYPIMRRWITPPPHRGRWVSSPTHAVNAGGPVLKSRDPLIYGVPPYWLSSHGVTQSLLTSLGTSQSLHWDSKWKLNPLLNRELKVQSYCVTSASLNPIELPTGSSTLPPPFLQNVYTSLKITLFLLYWSNE